MKGEWDAQSITRCSAAHHRDVRAWHHRHCQRSDVTPTVQVLRIAALRRL